jgi:hypothetical protein
VHVSEAPGDNTEVIMGWPEIGCPVGQVGPLVSSSPATDWVSRMVALKTVIWVAVVLVIRKS